MAPAVGRSSQFGWLEEYRRRWDERFDELDQVLEELKRKENSDEHQ